MFYWHSNEVRSSKLILWKSMLSPCIPKHLVYPSHDHSHGTAANKPFWIYCFFVEDHVCVMRLHKPHGWCAQKHEPDIILWSLSHRMRGGDGCKLWTYNFAICWAHLCVCYVTCCMKYSRSSEKWSDGRCQDSPHLFWLSIPDTNHYQWQKRQKKKQTKQAGDTFYQCSSFHAPISYTFPRSLV